MDISSETCPTLKPLLAGGREVASFASRVPYGLSSTLWEARSPCQFHAARVFAPDESLAATLSTGSGAEVGALLRALLQAFAQGTARLLVLDDTDLAEQAVALQQIQAQEDGRGSELSSVPGGFLLAVDEGRTFRGTPVVGRTLWFESKELAIKVGQAVSENMLDFD